MEIWQKIEIFQIQDSGRTPYWKSFFGNISAHIGQFMQISERRWRITGRYRSLNQSGNFRKFKMDGYKSSDLYPYPSQNYPISSKFSMPMQISIPRMAIWQKKIEIFQIQDGGGTPYWKSFFGYISAPYWPIDAKFGKEMKNHMPIQFTWPTLQLRAPGL